MSQQTETTSKATNNDSRPATGIIFFDGYCTLCNQWVDFLLRALKSRLKKSAHFPFQMASLQGETAKKVFNEAGRTEFITAPLNSIVLYRRENSDGTVRFYTESDAILRILSSLGFPWAILAIFRIVPPFIRDYVYGVIARNRYRWFGKKSECRLPTKEERQFLLD